MGKKRTSQPSQKTKPLLDPKDLRCCFCKKPITNEETVALIRTPAGEDAVTHLDHPGVRKNLIHDEGQIILGTLLHYAAHTFNQGFDAEENFESRVRNVASYQKT